MPEKQGSYCTVAGKAGRSEIPGKCAREYAGFGSINSINLKSEDCQSKKIIVSKTNLSECQGQEAGGHLCPFFFFPNLSINLFSIKIET